MSLPASPATIDRFIDLLVDAVARELEVPQTKNPAGCDPAGLASTGGVAERSGAGLAFLDKSVRLRPPPSSTELHQDEHHEGYQRTATAAT